MLAGLLAGWLREMCLLLLLLMMMWSCAAGLVPGMMLPGTRTLIRVSSKALKRNMRPGGDVYAAQPMHNTRQHACTSSA